MARFQSGQSGNPGGRPKIIGEVQEVAPQYTVEAVTTLAAIMRDAKAPPAARAMACNSILDRGYGKPPQALTTTVSGRSVRELTDVELMAIIANRSEPIRARSRSATTRSKEGELTARLLTLCGVLIVLPPAS